MFRTCQNGQREYFRFHSRSGSTVKGQPRAGVHLISKPQSLQSMALFEGAAMNEGSTVTARGISDYQVGGGKDTYTGWTGTESFHSCANRFLWEIERLCDVNNSVEG
eukprot:gb/GECG01000970.1/.p1 GENE.gb/GECG01000970.1/~~gb/GECG01000970.1/.p1  ORF type:complete len:107 (+),score=6.81 gb/GECG01000970.1/:1-321(+)